MQNVDGDDRTLEQLLTGTAFSIDYYQREYKWGQKQLRELIDDLHGQFIKTWDETNPTAPLSELSKYFLGSIVVNKSGGIRNLVDGQQRITTIMLLLIYLNHLQKDHNKKVDAVKTLIYAEEPHGKKFKLDIHDRNACMKALLSGSSYNPENESESVQNLVDRYADIEEIFPSQDMTQEAIYMFIWWIIRNVKVIEISTLDDEDAYTIFETMNDRGLSLSPTDMLRGYLLANITNTDKRNDADKAIDGHLKKFNDYGKKGGDTAAEFFKAWLRSQYSQVIRDKGDETEDFEKIGNEYHRWIKRNEDRILGKNKDFHKFVIQDMSFFARKYTDILDASTKIIPGLECVKYNTDAGFTLQPPLLLAAISPDDKEDAAMSKISIVADFIDIWLNLRTWNYKSNTYSTIKHTIFRTILDIRHKPIDELRSILYERLTGDTNQLDFEEMYRLSRNTTSNVRRILARITDWLELKSKVTRGYEDYMVPRGANAYDIEHIWSDNFEKFSNEFDTPEDFEYHRNLIGGLVLLPNKINRSLGNKSYEEKLQRYNSGQNILAASLHQDHYDNNPAFRKTIERYDLNFRPIDNFRKDEILERSRLYCDLAKLVWDPNRLLSK